MEGFAGHFSEVSDPRARNARHDFLEVMFVALAAALCGAEDCTEMALFARAKLDLLRQVVKLDHGAPSHDTFSRVFRMVAPEPFEAAFATFMTRFAGALQGVVDPIAMEIRQQSRDLREQILERHDERRAEPAAGQPCC